MSDDDKQRMRQFILEVFTLAAQAYKAEEDYEIHYETRQIAQLDIQQSDQVLCDGFADYVFEHGVSEIKPKYPGLYAGDEESWSTMKLFNALKNDLEGDELWPKEIAAKRVLDMLTLYQQRVPPQLQ